MTDIFNKLVDIFANENYAVGIFAFISVAICSIIFNLAKILSFGDERKKIKLNKIIDALKCEYISDYDKQHYEEALATEHFAISTGLRAEKELREAIIKCHQNCHGSLNFVHFKRSITYMKFENSTLNIKTTKLDKWLAYYNFIAAFLLFLSGVFILSLTGFIDFEEGIALLKHIGISLFLCLLAVVLFFDALPIISARRVKNVLEKQN